MSRLGVLGLSVISTVLATAMTSPSSVAAQGSEGLPPQFVEFTVEVRDDLAAGSIEVWAPEEWADVLEVLVQRGVLPLPDDAGPNFAGSLRALSFGCGTACQALVVVDLDDGMLYEGPAVAETGFHFRPHSELLVVNDPDVPAAACGAPDAPAPIQYWAWTGEGFEKVEERPAGC